MIRKLLIRQWKMFQFFYRDHLKKKLLGSMYVKKIACLANILQCFTYVYVCILTFIYMFLKRESPEIDDVLLWRRKKIRNLSKHFFYFLWE